MCLVFCKVIRVAVALVPIKIVFLYRGKNYERNNRVTSPEISRKTCTEAYNLLKEVYVLLSDSSLLQIVEKNRL